MEVWFPPEADAQEPSVTVNPSLGVLFTFDFMWFYGPDESHMLASVLPL